jgi:hypothetical protein
MLLHDRRTLLGGVGVGGVAGTTQPCRRCWVAAAAAAVSECDGGDPRQIEGLQRPTPPCKIRPTICIMRVLQGAVSSYHMRYGWHPKGQHQMLQRQRALQLLPCHAMGR